MKQKDALMPGSDVEGMRDGGGWRRKNGGEDRAEPHGQEREHQVKTAQRAFSSRSPLGPVSSLPIPTSCSSCRVLKITL